jgi:catechol 2,3-dioxygenase-like lactoylglutathione lyase family enzyme
MTHRGFSHIGLSTLDLDKTRAFYEGVLGFRPVVADTITIEEGGHLRHMFFDVGGGQLIAFVEPNGVPDIPAKYDAGINRGLGVPAGFYHFAFEAGLAAGLARKRDELQRQGCRDHRHRRSRLGPIDLLQRSQRDLARILLPGRQSSRDRCTDAQ